MSEPSKLVIAGKAYHVNAGTIRTLVGQHDELLAALCDAANDLAALRRHYAKEMSPGYRYAVDEEIARARAAIAKATEVQS